MAIFLGKESQRNCHDEVYHITKQASAWIRFCHNITVTLERAHTSNDPGSLEDALQSGELLLHNIDLAQLFVNGAITIRAGGSTPIHRCRRREKARPRLRAVVVAAESSLDDTVERQGVEGCTEVHQQEQQQDRYDGRPGRF